MGELKPDVDLQALNEWFADIPPGPYDALNTTGGWEVRQIDTDPANKHHWPFRLCSSITGQTAGCDAAVFSFIAGVINAWPHLLDADRTEGRGDEPGAMLRRGLAARGVEVAGADDPVVAALMTISHLQAEREGNPLANPDACYASPIREPEISEPVSDPYKFGSDDVVRYIARYGGMCRACADEDGICPTSGLPCENTDKAIRSVLEALSYGLKHGHVILPADAILNLAPVGESLALADVATERRRQVEAEGWTPEHDDKHGGPNPSLPLAAACYALSGAGHVGEHVTWSWPWADEWFKPSTPRRDLVKAAALLVAEIERLDRLPPPPQDR